MFVGSLRFAKINGRLMRVTCRHACVRARDDLMETAVPYKLAPLPNDQHNYLGVDTHGKTSTVPEEKQNNAGRREAAPPRTGKPP